MKKKVVLLLMTVCMLIGMLPAMTVTASAAGHTDHTADSTLYWAFTYPTNETVNETVLHIASKPATLTKLGIDANAIQSASTNLNTPAWYESRTSISNSFYLHFLSSCGKI